MFVFPLLLAVSVDLRLRTFDKTAVKPSHSRIRGRYGHGDEIVVHGGCFGDGCVQVIRQRLQYGFELAEECEHPPMMAEHQCTSETRKTSPCGKSGSCGSRMPYR